MNQQELESRVMARTERLIGQLQMQVLVLSEQLEQARAELETTKEDGPDQTE